MNPTRCLSSYVTTEILKFRNPQGTEENWILGGERINNKVIYYGKVVGTEVAVSLLCVTAAIETVAYSILLVGTLPLLLVSSRPMHMIYPLFQSSGFTLFWNVGNATVFNPFCTNVFTHESFARFSMDHWPRGQVFKAALKIAFEVAFAILQVLAARQGNYIYHHRNANDFNFFDVTFFRSEDILYVADWMINHHIRLLGQQAAQAHPLIRAGQNMNNNIEEGTEFFKEFILGPGQIDTEAREKILEADPDIYVFALTRAVYIYTFGDKRNEATPSFFNGPTKLLIDQMRQNYTQADGAVLEPAMQDSSKFEEEPDTLRAKNILKDLKSAAHKELQGTFVTRCWQKACQEAQQEADAEAV